MNKVSMRGYEIVIDLGKDVLELLGSAYGILKVLGLPEVMLFVFSDSTSEYKVVVLWRNVPSFH